MNSHYYKRNRASIPLALGSNICIKDRLSISNGVLKHTSDEFQKNAFTPKQIWTQANVLSKSHSDMSSRLDTEINGYCALFSVPDEIYSYLSVVAKGLIKNKQGSFVDILLKNESYRYGAALLLEWLRYSNNNVNYLGHYYRVPNLKSASIDDKGKLIGLHLDSFCNRTLSNRDKGYPYRVCVNLGPEARYFTYISKNVLELQNKPSEMLDDCPITFVKNYLNKNTEITVNRLRIEPGEAYVAPTEIIIHDANTLSKSFLDVSLTYLGEFDFQSMRKIVKFESIYYV